MLRNIVCPVARSRNVSNTQNKTASPRAEGITPIIVHIFDHVLSFIYLLLLLLFMYLKMMSVDRNNVSTCRLTLF
jgi:hypothetical protein